MESLRKYLGKRLYVVRMKKIVLCGKPIRIPDMIFVKLITEIRCSNYNCPIYRLYNTDDNVEQFLGCVDLRRAQNNDYTLKDIIVPYLTSDNCSNDTMCQAFTDFDDMIKFVTDHTRDQLNRAKLNVESIQLMDERG